MSIDFEKYAMKGNEFLNRLAQKLGDEGNRDRAARILRSVLHALRNRLTAEESLQLLSQLPMALKGVYVDGWNKIGPDKGIKTLEDFANEVIKEEGKTAWRDFSNMDEVGQAIHAVIETLVSYVSVDEMEEAFGTLPQELKKVFNTWIPS